MKVKSFIVLTNIIFIPLFLLVGVTTMLGLPSVVFDVMLCIASWSSTFAFLILFKRIYPNQSRIDYIKSKFKTRLNWGTVSLIVFIQTLIFVGVTYIVGSKEDLLFNVSSMSMLIYFFLKNLLAGPLGEELGWRGFAGEELQKKYSPLKSALIIGFWWGVWHTPIWFTTGLKGQSLVLYIVLFMISVMAISIVIMVFYNLNKNLVIPIVTHQFFNFYIGLIRGDILELLGYYTIFYSILAILLIIINPRQSLYSHNGKWLKV